MVTWWSSIIGCCRQDLYLHGLLRMGSMMPSLIHDWEKTIILMRWHAWLLVLLLACATQHGVDHVWVRYCLSNTPLTQPPSPPLSLSLWHLVILLVAKFISSSIPNIMSLFHTSDTCYLSVYFLLEVFFFPVLRHLHSPSDCTLLKGIPSHITSYSINIGEWTGSW